MPARRASEVELGRTYCRLKTPRNVYTKGDGEVKIRNTGRNFGMRNIMED
jgi:hypothetical protein